MTRLTRYGLPCAVCGILRDYHGLAGPRPDHSYTPPADHAHGTRLDLYAATCPQCAAILTERDAGTYDVDGRR